MNNHWPSPLKCDVICFSKLPLSWMDGCWGLTRVLISTITVEVGHSRRYCNIGYDQSQGRRLSTLKCIGSISRRRYRAPTIRQKLVRIRTADREVMVAPGGTAIPGRPVSRTETKITSQPSTSHSSTVINCHIFLETRPLERGIIKVAKEHSRMRLCGSLLERRSCKSSINNEHKFRRNKKVDSICF